jgi:hypothetical protein
MGREDGLIANKLLIYVPTWGKMSNLRFSPVVLFP